MPLSTMNWRRGLLRLWAVAAVLWVGVVVYARWATLACGSGAGLGGRAKT